MAKQIEKAGFGALAQRTIAENNLDMQAVADGARINISTLYRTFKQPDPSKGKACAIIASINRTAGYEVINMADAMRSAGFDEDVLDEEYLTGPSLGERVAKLIDMFAHLPFEVQLDVSAMVEALRKRHSK